MDSSPEPRGDVAERIKNALSDRDCIAVAKNTGLSIQTIRALKAGKSKRPSFGTVKIMVEYLGVNPLNKVETKI